jgi:hypothetical protein
MSTPIEILRRFSIVYMEVHTGFNVDPKYHDVNIVINRMKESGFSQVKNFTYYSVDENNIQFDTGVYVQKWVRV